MKFIPLLLQIVGALSLVASATFSFSMIVGAGIGSPNGSVHDDYYWVASLLLIASGLLFLVGWLWVNIGYIVCKGRLRSSQKVDSSQTPRVRQPFPPVDHP